MKHITRSTTQQKDIIDITDTVESHVAGTGIVTIFVQHTSCAVTINEHTDASVGDDIHSVLENHVPWNGSYEHNEADDNAAAHVKASIIGSSVQAPFTNGNLHLGQWQRILLVEFDGPRKRRIAIKPSIDP